MNHFFAHNGVSHGTRAEAVTHQANEVVPTVLLVTASVVIGMTLAVWALNRLSAHTVNVKSQDEE